MRRRATALVATLLVAGGLGACDPPPPPPPGTNPNAACPAGWTRTSSQWWGQADGVDADALTDVPQQLPPSVGEGGHQHVEFCFPIAQRIDTDSLTLSVTIKTHQRNTGSGDRIDVGVAPGGGTLAQVAAPDLAIGGPTCGGTFGPAADPHQMCSATVSVTVPLTGLSAGKQVLRIRYLSTDHPSGSRSFISNEMPFFYKAAPTGCPEVEGKGWMDAGGTDYARSGIKSCLPTGPVSGTWTFTQSARSTNDPISGYAAFVDARFGHDEFTGQFGPTITPSPTAGSVTASRSLDTTTLANGWHCIGLVTQVKIPGTDQVNTGVLEFPIEVQNPTPGTGVGKGACFP